MCWRPLFWILLIPSILFGQYTYVFNRYSLTDGLNTNKVNCVWQDQQGFLWIGTEVGIQRFDGRKFASFRYFQNESPPPSLGIDQIIGDEDGKIWLLQGSQIGRFDSSTFQYESVKIGADRDIPARNEFRLFKDSKGIVFLCASKYGLFWYDRNLGMFVNTGLPIQVPTNWGINNVIESAETGEYFLTSEEGLALFDSRTGSLFYKDHNPDQIPFFNPNVLPNTISFLKSTDRTWWATYWDYNTVKQSSVLLHYDPKLKTLLSDTLEHQPNYDYVLLNQILETENGQLWVGGANSLLSYEKNLRGFSQYLKSSPSEFDIKATHIRNLFEDREGNIWLSTENGLYVVDPKMRDIYNILVIDGLKKESAVNALLETQNGENWIGTWGIGILIYNQKFQEIPGIGFNDLNQEDVNLYGKIWDLCQHKTSGTIWSASQSGTLAVFDPKTKQVLHYLRPPVFEESTVRQIIEDRQGNLWFGTQSGQLVKWDGKHPIGNGSLQSVLNLKTIILRLYVDKDGLLWVGTHKDGVYVIDPKRGEILNHYDRELSDRNLISDNSVMDIQQFNDSIFFVGSDILNIVNKNSGNIKNITQRDGLNGSKISQMLMDDDGTLWFISNNGLSSYNYQKDIVNSYNNLHEIIYGEKTSATKWKMNNGELWFGGEDVVFGFDPSILKNNETPPAVVLTDFKLLNRFLNRDSILAQKEITFKHDQNSVTFYFSALTFNKQYQLQYYYRLLGLNDDWVRAERNLTANYTTLPPGRYTFQLKSRNFQGKESEKITALDFKILPPFYASSWFIVLIGLLIIGLVYFFYKLKINQLLALERLRNKVARDLHDDMGSTLSTINILSSMAKSKIVSDTVKSSTYLTKITDNSQRMMEDMDDIVWSIKPDNDNMHKIIARMREYATGVLEAKDITLQFQTEEHIYAEKLNMESRRDLFLIFKEVINNTVKYAHCNAVTVHINIDKKRLYMTIKDDGIGFDLTQVAAGNGLENIKNRSLSLGGHLQIKSTPGQGTEINLEIPMR